MHAVFATLQPTVARCYKQDKATVAQLNICKLQVVPLLAFPQCIISAQLPHVTLYRHYMHYTLCFCEVSLFLEISADK